MIEIDNIPKDFKGFYPTGINYGFLYDGVEYFFKEDELDGDSKNEIINELIATTLGQDNARYDMAAYHGRIGSITQTL